MSWFLDSDCVRVLDRTLSSRSVRVVGRRLREDGVY